MPATDALFRTLFEQAPVGIALIDTASGRIHDANGRFAEITGHARENLARLEWGNIANACDGLKGRTDLAKLDAGEITGFRVKTRYRRPDGNSVWFDVTARPIEAEAGGTALHLAFVEDITDHVRAETALADAQAELLLLAGESRLIRIFDESVIGFAKLCLDGRIIRANDRYGEITGRPREQLVGTPLQDLALREDWAAVQAQLEGLLSGGSPGTLALRFQRGDGAIVWTSATLNVLRDAHGQPLQFVMLALDLTRHKLDEDRFRQGEESLRVALEGARLGTMHWDLLSGRIVLSKTSRDYLGLTGSAASEFAALLALVHRDDRERVQDLIHEAIATCGSFEADCRVIWSNGTAHWIALSGRVSADIDGKASRAEGVISSIGVRKANEGALVRAAQDLAARAAQVERLNRQLAQRAVEAEGANRAKTTFLNTMSHELRTPLNAIIGFSAMLLEDLMGAVTDEQRKALTVVLRSSHQLLALIQEILDLSRIESGQQKLDVVPVLLWHLLEEQCEEMQPQARERKLELRCLPCEDAIAVLADRDRLAQIVRNLVGNAIKFTDQGSVTVRVSVVPGMARIEVRDTGVGIGTDDQLKLFQPFQRIEGPAGSVRPGTGLGLAICKRYVEAMGGEIGIDSHPGQGSCFWFTLPLTAPD